MSMCVEGTRVSSDYRTEFGLWVKHEEECCPGGPNFSKTRGVYAHVAKRPESVIGVLDTSHSQGGWAVARACQMLGKHCVLYYPVRKADRDETLGWDPTGKGSWGDVLKPQQLAAQELGASLIPLQAGRSAVLYHAAKRDLAGGTASGQSYFMPNALKLPEMITETAAEVRRTFGERDDVVFPSGVCVPRHVLKNMNVKTVLISASSGTIAAGVCRGLLDLGWRGEVVVHQGYSRPQGAMRQYMHKISGADAGCFPGITVTLVDEGYSYADEARPGVTPPWPSNPHYDLKCFRWWMREGRARYHEACLWNIG